MLSWTVIHRIRAAGSSPPFQPARLRKSVRPSKQLDPLGIGSNGLLIGLSGIATRQTYPAAIPVCWVKSRSVVNTGAQNARGFSFGRQLRDPAPVCRLFLPKSETEPLRSPLQL